MSRFDFYEKPESQKVATVAADWLLTELEKFHRNRSYGRITVEVDIRQGEPVEVVVTPEVRVKARDLLSDDG